MRKKNQEIKFPNGCRIIFHRIRRIPLVQWLREQFGGGEYRGHQDPPRDQDGRIYQVNPELLKKAKPDYIKMLQELPEEKKKAWISGDWTPE